MKQSLAALSAALSFFLLFRSATVQEGLLFLLAVLLHESGHILASICCGCPIRSFFLSPGGLTLEMDFSLIPYKKEILIYLAGPFANALGAAITFFLIRWSHNLYLFYFLFCNLLFFSLNLLPVSGLDGYGFLFSFFSLHTSPEEAKKILSHVSTLFLLLLLPPAIYLLIQTKNASLLLFLLMLLSKGQTKKATKYS